MPHLSRHNWASLKAEVVRRLGGRTEPSIASRVELWLDAAQLDLGCTVHHFELDKTDSSLLLSLDTSTVTLPADCFIVMGVALRDQRTEAFKKWLTLNHLRYVQANYSDTPATPGEYARFGNQLQFSCASNLTYQLLIRYYKLPSPPDFTSGTPEFSRLWDEHLIEGALAKAQGAIWRPDLAGANGQMLQEYLGSQVQPALLVEMFPDRPTAPTANRTHGGAQG